MLFVSNGRVYTIKFALKSGDPKKLFFKLTHCSILNNMLKIYVGAYYALHRFLVQYSVLYKTDTITDLKYFFLQIPIFI
jgi:hypothetical protein